MTTTVRVSVRCPICNKLLSRGFEGRWLEVYCGNCKMAVTLDRNPPPVGRVSS